MATRPQAQPCGETGPLFDERPHCFEDARPWLYDLLQRALHREESGNPYSGRPLLLQSLKEDRCLCWQEGEGHCSLVQEHVAVEGQRGPNF